MYWSGLIEKLVLERVLLWHHFLTYADGECENYIRPTSKVVVSVQRLLCESFCDST